jgi:hypothetical protein
LFGAHAHQFASIARSVEVDLGTPQESDAVARADGSFADLRAAQRFAFEVEDFDTAFGLIWATREYAMRTMRYEVFAWADASSRLDAGVGHPLHPMITAIRGYGAFVRGEFDAALSLASSARLTEQAHGVTPSGLAERVLANVLCATGQIELGMIEISRQLEVAQASGNDSQLAHACYMQSMALSWTGDFDEAKSLVERGSAAARRTGALTDLASTYVAEGFAARDDSVALDAFATADRLARNAGNRWMSAFARTEASGLLVHRGCLADGCAGLADTVDTWYKAGEWAQQWHTMSRCLIALERIGQHEVGAQVLGAIDAHFTMGAPPVMPRLRTLAFETRDAVSARLGDDRSLELQAIGASLPVRVVVDRARNALLGRLPDE